MIPTPQQLRDEIEGGPLSLALAPFWGDVFPTEPEPAVEDTSAHARWERLVPRFGKLTGDAIYGIQDVFNSVLTGRFVTSYMIYRGQFAGMLASVTLILATKSETVQAKWRPVLTLVPAEDVQVDVRNIADILDAAVTDELMSAELVADIKDGSPVPCSRLTELGWTGVTADLLQQARVLES